MGLVVVGGSYVHRYLQPERQISEVDRYIHLDGGPPPHQPATLGFCGNVDRYIQSAGGPPPHQVCSRMLETSLLYITVKYRISYLDRICAAGENLV